MTPPAIVSGVLQWHRDAYEIATETYAALAPDTDTLQWHRDAYEIATRRSTAACHQGLRRLQWHRDAYEIATLRWAHQRARHATLQWHRDAYEIATARVARAASNPGARSNGIATPTRSRRVDLEKAAPLRDAPMASRRLRDRDPSLRSRLKEKG